MSRQTTNYGLTKPDYTDIADIEVVNSNMDIIDGALKVIDTKSNNVMSKNSSAWSSTVAYAVGQYCIYNNSLWKCLVQHSGQTPQEGTYWARVSLDTLGSEINALNSSLNNIEYGSFEEFSGWNFPATNYICKKNGFVIINFAVHSINPLVTGSYVSCKISSKNFRPIKNISFTGNAHNQGSTRVPITFTIDTNGNIGFEIGNTNLSSTVDWFVFSGIYVV